MAGERRIPALRIELKPSRVLAWLLACMHLLAALAVMAAVAQWPLRAAAGLALLASALRTIGCHALLRAGRAVTALEFRDELQCTLVQRDGSRAEACVQGSSYVTPALTVLHVRQQGCRSRRCVVLMTDSAAPQSLRRLRVRLRWGTAATTRSDDETAPL